MKSKKAQAVLREILKRALETKCPIDECLVGKVIGAECIKDGLFLRIDCLKDSEAVVFPTHKRVEG